MKPIAPLTKAECAGISAAFERMNTWPRPVSIARAAILVWSLDRPPARCHGQGIRCPGTYDAALRVRTKGTAAMSERMCLGCGVHLTQRDVRETVVRDDTHAPFCAACVQSSEGMTFDEWLDEQWQRQRPH